MKRYLEVGNVYSQSCFKSQKYPFLITYSENYQSSMEGSKTRAWSLVSGDFRPMFQESDNVQNVNGPFYFLDILQQ